MNGNRAGLMAAIVVSATVLLAAPIALVRLALPDAPAPAGLGTPIQVFSDAIGHLFERSPLVYARFEEMETGPDNLVVLYFETRSYPYLALDAEVYLVSRCVPIGVLQPIGMGGGTVVGGSRATDTELAYLRSDEQPPCDAEAP